MPRSVRILPAAARDLEAIHEYTVAEFGSAQADRYLSGLQAAVERLADFPRLGAKTRAGSGIRVWHHQVHRIVYRDTGYELVVSRILHAARNVDLVLEHYAALRRAGDPGE